MPYILPLSYPSFWHQSQDLSFQLWIKCSCVLSKYIPQQFPDSGHYVYYSPARGPYERPPSSRGVKEAASYGLVPIITFLCTILICLFLYKPNQNVHHDDESSQAWEKKIFWQLFSRIFLRISQFEGDFEDFINTFAFSEQIIMRSFSIVFLLSTHSTTNCTVQTNSF